MNNTPSVLPAAAIYWRAPYSDNTQIMSRKLQGDDDGLDFEDFAASEVGRQARLKGGGGKSPRCPPGGGGRARNGAQVSSSSAVSQQSSASSRSRSSSKRGGSSTSGSLLGSPAGSSHSSSRSPSTRSTATARSSVGLTDASSTATGGSGSARRSPTRRTISSMTPTPLPATAAAPAAPAVPAVAAATVVVGRTKNQRLRWREDERGRLSPTGSSGVATITSCDELAGGGSLSLGSTLPSSPGSAESSTAPPRRVRFSEPRRTTLATTAGCSNAQQRGGGGGGRPPLATTRRGSVGGGAGAKKSDAWLAQMTTADRRQRHVAAFPEILRRRQPEPVRPTRRAVTMSTVFSVRDAGNYQMLFDECTFLCSAIRLQSDVAAAADLVFMLSSKPNRRTLFGRNNNNSDGGPSALDAVLGVLAWTETLLAPAERKKDVVPVAIAAQGRTKAARMRQVEELEEPTDSPVATAAASPVGSLASFNGKVERSGGRRQLLDAIGMCLYFVSMDCTLSDEAAYTGSTGASKAARRIRRALLTSSECLQGILCMVLADPMTRRMLGEVPTDAANEAFDGSVVAMSPLEYTKRKKMGDDDSVTNTSNSLASSIVGDTPDSQSSSGSIDPTLAGRRKLKRRRLEKQHAALGIILERDNLSEFDGLPAGGTGRDNEMLSFTSESPLGRNHFPGVRERPTNGDLESAASEDINSAASSTDSHTLKARDRLDQVTAGILDSMQTVDREKFELAVASSHRCGRTDQNAYWISSYLPLAAITRIIGGKCEEGDVSCIDDHTGNDEGGLDAARNDDDDDDYNPLLETNRMLGENGAIPLLSQALAEALSAVTHQLDLAAGGPHHCPCPGCLAALQDRVSLLVSLVDGASLLSESNRQQLCEEGFTSRSGGFLIVGLIAVLNRLLANGGSGSVLFDGVWGEITLSTLRMLTSLTHENKTAAKELEVALAERPGNNGRRTCGLDVVAGVLRQAVKSSSRRSNDVADGKLIYDSVIFCLNVLANVVESGGSCRLLSEMKVPSDDGDEETENGYVFFLSWLTRWLVGETHSFREAVMESTFGTSPSKHQERKLDDQEDEKLVIAGNGFVLLTSLIVDDDNEDDEANKTGSSAQKIILSELPGSDRDAKMTFLKNTLKAFCNFYHYSIGELSVAVVAPVKQLIKRLELIQEQRR